MSQKANTYQRLESLDALRGISILLMVLSSSIAFGGVLPAWMYHAQVPPPQHVFKPDLAGITWVDLVFPIFLFSMGAAIPLSLHKKLRTDGLFKTILAVLKRFLLLAFFALFTFHARAWVMQKDPAMVPNLISIGCYILLFLIYTNWQSLFGKKIEWGLKTFGLVAAILFMMIYPFTYGRFDFTHSDIIILVLANMALFGSVVWIITQKHPLWRIALLPLIAAIFLSSADLHSWNSIMFNWSPAAWLYKFYYLKYLFIILPATLVGDWLVKYTQQSRKEENYSIAWNQKNLIAALCFSLVVVNLIGLYNRFLISNLFASVIICLFVYYLVRQKQPFPFLIGQLVKMGIYLLILGLFFEAYEGGIKKDFSTYSYYFVTTGLAVFTLLSLLLLEKTKFFQIVIRYFSLNGKNPMIAYTTGNLLLLPLLKITNTYPFLDSLQHNAWEGLIRGLLFTAAVSLITVFCTRKKIFWKT